MAQDNPVVSKQNLVNEIEQARRDWLHAWQNFREAEGEFIQAAVYELKAKEEKYRALLRLAKTKGA